MREWKNEVKNVCMCVCVNGDEVCLVYGVSPKVLDQDTNQWT